MNRSPWNVDIAIIGLSCRFPGAATAEEYWKNLCAGVESVSFFSDQQLIAGGVDPALVANPDYVKAAPILPDVEMFDASFFGYSPKDAALMDPQHRLFLEVAWETFENAGYDPAGYPGKIGVLSSGGGVVSTYLLAKLYPASLIDQTASTSHINNDKDFLSTRVAFKLNLRGPSFTIQSACSSSTLAVHQACQMLRFGECDMMLVGGSTVRVPQVDGYLAEKRNLYSLDGHCRPFDAAGQGTIFGSGVGAVLLKHLEKAVADRDQILAVIKGTAANNDGSAKISYTAPSLGQQSEAVIDALGSAAVSADSVGYVECHSTGTTVGDPLEIEALTMAFRKDSARKQYCAIGSVKGNIGHPEQAAGIAGLIKTALVLHHKKIPPSINYETPNPRIDFASSPFYVITDLQDFPIATTPRRAGLNSLGIGGTNVFVLLEEAPATPSANQSPDHSPCLVTLSAKTAEALVRRVEQLLDWLNDNPDAAIGDLCFTTNVSRSQFAFRFAAPARSHTELKKHLAAWLQTTGQDPSSLKRTSSGPVAFMFYGQGPQHAGMAAKLYRTHSVFRNAMDRCNALATPHLESGLLEVIFAERSDDALVNRTDYTQPALFAVEYALTELLKSWGLTPKAAIGHSLGEIAAACAADVMSLEDAVRLVTARGTLMHRVPNGGAMASIWAGESVVRQLIAKVSPSVDVAAMNGPLNTVVSADEDALTVLLEELDRQGITYRKLRISNGFHSARTEPILGDLEQVASELKHHAPKLPLVSNLTGELFTAAPDKSYWSQQLRKAVRFGDGMSALGKLECRTFLEIGPHPVLLPMAQACLGTAGKSANWVATLNRQKSDAESIAEMLVALYLAGQTINWTAVHAESSWRRIPLPTYPFQRERHWIKDEAIRPRRAGSAVSRPHPLVGERIPSTDKAVRYQARYGVQHAGYFSDHKVAGTAFLPTTAELEAAIVVGRTFFGTSQVDFDNAMHHQAMSFGDGEERIVRVLVTPLKSDRASFRLVSAGHEGAEVWHTHMTGTLRKSEAPSRPMLAKNEILARCRKTLSVADFYNQLHELGLEYGRSFRGVRELHIGQNEALARVRLPDDLADTQYVMHPAFFDACLHAYPFVLDRPRKTNGVGPHCYLPISVGGFRCCQDAIADGWAHITLRSVEKDETQVVDIQVYDEAGRPVAELQALRVRFLPLQKLQARRAEIDDCFYQLAWRMSARASVNQEKDRAPASWLIFADAKGVGEALARKLETQRHRCHLVFRDHAFSQQSPRQWTVNERRPDDCRQLLEQFEASERLPCRGVVYLWGLDAPSIEGLTLERLKSGSEMICRGALAILHALAATRSGNRTGRRLWFVTANSQRAGGENQQVDPVQAPLWGLGRTAAIEYPAIWGGSIDLQLSAGRTQAIDELAEELLHPAAEGQVAISAEGRRSVPRFVRCSLAELPAQLPQVRADASYLVTGGLGMLGRSVAKWLIDKGAKHLVLTGRTASAEAAQEVFGAAEINSGAIRVEAADISREEDVSRLMQTISNELPPLKGVVHSAGVLDDGVLAQLDWGRFERLFEPKVYASWLLHEYTKSLDLDFFILKSSLLSLLGSAGQGNYTASGAFVDSLTAHRHAVGLRAMAINWCAWSEGGLATVSGARGEAMWSSLGMKFVSPAVAMQMFDELMHRDVDQIAVADAHWPTYAAKIPNPALLSELLGRNPVSKPLSPAVVTPAPNAAPITANAASITANGRQWVLSTLQTHIMAELGFEEPIDPDRPLNELGLDSLMSVKLANSLENEFGVPISVAELLRGPTINQLADHLLDLLADVDVAKRTGTDPAIASRAASGTLPIHPGTMHASVSLQTAAEAYALPSSTASEVRIATEQFQDGGGLQQVTNGHALSARATGFSGTEHGPWTHASVGTDEETPHTHNGNGAGTVDFDRPVTRSNGIATRTAGKWLIAPRRNPNAKARLFCFPYAGGGLVSFRPWAHLLGDSVEVVAVEPPGRGTRINEVAIEDLDTFVEQLLPEMLGWLDRPAAFFGHCLGGLTMFRTLTAISGERAHFIKHCFACGVRPPHLLKRRGAFEDELVYDLMLHRDFDVSIPPYAQTDDIFADIIRHFDIQAADKMLETPKLRTLLLPTVRAEFKMAFNYEYQPVEPFSFPISSFVGHLDPWVSAKDSADWSKLTRAGFKNHLRKGSHFLMADDRDYILATIKREFVDPLG
jgi:acyl transferase domain-containing protein/surfactin synthase thioesterase subunit/aryl carrier-like protein